MLEPRMCVEQMVVVGCSRQEKLSCWGWDQEQEQEEARGCWKQAEDQPCYRQADGYTQAGLGLEQMGEVG